jgi:hypothetical protein
MIEERHRELHRFIQERARASYRSAFYYERDNWEPLYVRDDVASNRLRDELPDIVKRARQNQPLLREEDYPPLGEVHATSEVHEDGVILHFPEGPDEGTIVSLDRDAARRLAGFVSQAMTIFQSPQSSEYRTGTVDD